MATPGDIIRKLTSDALAECDKTGQSRDALGRAMFEAALKIWRDCGRSPDHIRTEIVNAAAHLDPDEDFMFMRP
jgi:hypothetical protein